MKATNADVPMDVAGEVSTLGICVEEDDIYENEEEVFPSATEIVSAQTVVTPLGDIPASPPSVPFNPSAVRMPDKALFPH